MEPLGISDEAREAAGGVVMSVSVITIHKRAQPPKCQLDALPCPRGGDHDHHKANTKIA